VIIADLVKAINYRPPIVLTSSKENIAATSLTEAKEKRLREAYIAFNREKRMREVAERKKARELPDRFGLPNVENEDSERVQHILRLVIEEQPIKEDDLVWLGTDRSIYWTNKLRYAHHANMASISTKDWLRTGDVWKAIDACSQWRKAQCSEKGLGIVEDALIKVGKANKPRSALLTTGGGALRDLGRCDDAVRFGKEAHSLKPEDFRPCTLLGAVSIEMGSYARGAEWYEKAEALGASSNLIDRELQSILNAVSHEKRSQIKKALKASNPSRYDQL
jgi:hypothetical protein